MSYNHLAGQVELRRLLCQAAIKGTVNQAVLFTGPVGSGKKSWGMALAQTILCESPRAGEACGQCRSCRRISGDNHENLFSIQPEGRSIKINQIRSLRRFFYLAGSNKVCLIDRAESMTAETAASLLKILEEPPPGLYFILLATRPDRIMDTVLSRCTRYQLLPLHPAEIKAILVERSQLDESSLTFAVSLSGGIPGRALDISSDPVFAERLAQADHLLLFLGEEKRTSGELLEKAAVLEKQEDLLPLLELAATLSRSLLLAGYGQAPEDISLCKDGLAEIAGPEALFEEWLTELNRAMTLLTTTNANRLLLLEALLIKMYRGYKNAQSSGSSI